jgi:NDP-sugar pyrophosphorylase family protein
MMKALILAGGKGSRLQPYTTVLPKPLMPVGDLPILEIILRQLSHAGVREVILAVSSHSPLFRALFEEGQRFGLAISYSLEEKPLGTAGPIAQVLDRLDEDFLVMNGDLLTTLNYGNLFAFHQKKRAAATLATYDREVKVDFGLLEPDQEGRLVNYIEKPTHKFSVSMGVYAMNKKAVSPYLKPGEYLDVPDLMQRLLADQREVYCYREPCYWLDIGRVDDYQTAIEVFEQRRGEFLPSGE